ncbi:sialidase [Chloropicon primus]|uniref:Sialidase n=1 Tax=Chloropicon primus TaxID=1764295 RepID=A0A5B8MJ31_9CHLO|nr:sialidase [Chloropicon primus]UPQ99636.1 sialidase [Chloropicon primus]|eukprot:QDZ20427.1 sialidase [Chloropicon primus]
MRPRRSQKPGHHGKGGSGSGWKRRLTKTKVVLLAMAAVLAGCTLFAFFHTVDSLHHKRTSEGDFMSNQVQLVGEGSQEGVPSLSSGNQPSSEMSKKRRRRRRGGEGHFEKDCYKDVFKFRSPISSSSADLSSSSNLSGKRESRQSSLLRPTHDAWITHGDSRYANAANLEVDASNHTVVYAAWQASDTHEGAKDQFIQLAVSTNRGMKWRFLPSKVNHNKRNTRGFLPVWSPVLHSRQNGELLLFYAQSRHNCRVKGRTDWYTPGGDIYVVKSNDGGQTLGPPVVVRRMASKPLTLTGSLVTLREGKRETWVLPVNEEGSQSTCISTKEGKGHTVPGILYSTDQGRSWNFTLVLDPEGDRKRRSSVRVEPGKEAVVDLRIGSNLRDGSLVSTDHAGKGQMLQFYRSSKSKIFTGKLSNFGKQWDQPKETDLPNPDSKLSAFRLRDGIIVTAFNNATRKGRLSNLYLAGCFDQEGLDWGYIARIENSPRTVFSNPTMAQVDLESKRPGPLLVAYSVAERVFGHMHSGVIQSRGIKVASLNLNSPRMYVRRGKQAVSYRANKLNFDLGGGDDGDRHSHLNPPCLSLYHPSLFAIFKSPLTDQAEIRATVGMQLKISPKQKQVKGQEMYSGLGTEDFGEIFFNAKSNITTKLLTLKACDESRCRESRLEKDSISLVTISGVYASSTVVDEYSSPVLAYLKIDMLDGDGEAKAVTVHVDAEKKGEWLQLLQEFRFLVKRWKDFGDDDEDDGSEQNAYRLELYFGEERVTDFEWKGKQPSYITFGCSKSLQGMCSPSGRGLCGKSISTKLQWHLKDIRIETQRNRCIFR